jgi:hypothetical protein
MTGGAEPVCACPEPAAGRESGKGEKDLVRVDDEHVGAAHLVRCTCSRSRGKNLRPPSPASQGNRTTGEHVANAGLVGGKASQRQNIGVKDELRFQCPRAIAGYSSEPVAEICCICVLP